MIFPLKLVYVCGPIKGDRRANVERGRAAGVEVWRRGAVAVVPHLNSDGLVEHEGVSVSDVYLGDLALLGRCDAMVRLPGWEDSVGCNYETAWALYKDIPIFDDMMGLEAWLNS